MIGLATADIPITDDSVHKLRLLVALVSMLQEAAVIHVLLFPITPTIQHKERVTGHVTVDFTRVEIPVSATTIITTTITTITIAA